MLFVVMDYCHGFSGGDASRYVDEIAIVDEWLRKLFLVVLVVYYHGTSPFFCLIFQNYFLKTSK